MIRVLIPLLFSTNLFANNVASDFSHINFSTNDEKAARNYHTVIRDLRVDKVDSKKVSLFQSAIAKSDAFSDVSPLVEQLQSIAKINNDLDKFHSSCGKNIPNVDIKKVNASYKNLDQQIRKYCRGLFLKIISSNSKNKRISDELKNKNLMYLNRSLIHYLKGERTDLFNNFFSAIDKDTTFHQTINSLISEKYINKKITPRENVLRTLDLNEELTSYIQQKGLKGKDNTKFFNQEFTKLYDRFKTTFESGKTEESIAIANQIITFHKANQDLISKDLSWIRLSIMGRFFSYSEYTKESIEVFDYALQVAKNNNNQEQIDDSIFNLLWVGILKKDYKQALKVVEAYKLLEDYSKLDSRIKYWVAHVIDNRDEKTLANHLYKQIIDNSPMNFYSIIAQKELSARGKFEEQQIKPSSVVREFHNYEFSKEFENSVKRLKVWLALGIDSISNSELSDILSKRSDEIFLTQKNRVPASHDELRAYLVRNLASVFNNQEKYLHTFRLVHQSLSSIPVQSDEEMLSYLFPFQYFDRIKSIDKEIDPIIVISLIRQESAFNPKAKSNVGARGLMQLMPMTAKQLNKRVKTNDLNTPDINLSLGIKYLKKLLNKYDGNLVHALAAYNAGERRVSDWKKTVFVSDDPLLQIESIPFKETRNYVKLIYRNMYYYRLLSDEPAIRLPIADSFKTTLNQATVSKTN